MRHHVTELPSSAVRLYFLLQGEDEVRVDLAELGLRLRRSRRTISDALKALVDGGYLTRTRRGIYTLSEPT